MSEKDRTPGRRRERVAVTASVSEDMPGWLALAREVEPLFGPMVDDPGFQVALERAIRENRAFLVRNEIPAPLPDALDRSDAISCSLAGGIIIDPVANEIVWLAVSASYRGRGLGRALLEAAMPRLCPDRPMHVTTFAASAKEGRPARRLYKSFGFRDLEAAKHNPAGIPVFVMVRPVPSP